MRSSSLSFAPVLVVCAFALGCSAAPDSSDEAGEAAVSTCNAVDSVPTTTQQTDDSGKLQSTTISVKASGCIDAGTSTADVVDAIARVLQDDAMLANVAGPNGKMFASYRAKAATGSLDSKDGVSRLIDVTFNASKKPSTTVRVTLRKGAGGVLNISITNTTGVGVLFFTAVDPGGLDIELTAKPQDGVVRIGGTTTLVVKAGYENSIDGMDEMPKLVISWLRDQVAK
jgi:hypothetical protein